MEAVGLSTCALPPVDFTAQSFYKVTSAILDPSKHWYLLLKEVCGVPLCNFSYAMYLRYFPTKSKVSPRGNIVNLVNSTTLDFESEGVKNLSFGAKTSQDSEELVSLLAERSARVNSLEVEVKELLARISHLESSTEASLDDSSLPNSPCCSSTPLSSSSSSCSSIDDTKNRPDLGTINKKRQVLKRCRKITAVLDDVSERYNESIAAVLGNSFLYGTDGKEEKVQGIISEVLDLIITKSKGSRNGLTELLSPQTLAKERVG